MQQDSTIRICLWSGPRNISTALMYSFAQRNDTEVFDEPLYGHYLQHTQAKEYHPGAEAILASMENDGEKVIDMMMGKHEKPVVFFKNMTHHLLDLKRNFLKDVVNIILTRNPVEMLPSFAKVIDSPSMKDVGYEDHIILLEQLEQLKEKPIVVDSTQVVLNPQKALEKICAEVQISFDNNMLSWEAGPRPEDGVWAKYWYKSVHQSLGFAKYKPKTEPFPEKLKPLLAECMPHYERLMKLSVV